MDEPKQKIKPLVRGVRDAVAKEVLSARNLPVGIVRGSIPEAAEMTTDQRCIMRCRISKFFLRFFRVVLGYNARDLPPSCVSCRTVTDSVYSEDLRRE